MHTSLLLSLVIFTEISHEVSAFQSTLKYWTRKSVKIKQNYVMDEYKTRTMLLCLFDCSSMDDCLSVSWGKIDKHCLLSTIDQTNDGSYAILPTEVEEAAGWNTMTRIRYPVAHVLGRNGRYTLTFEQAKHTCEERGAEIADPDDLLVARSMGYEMCSWGWLSDGRIGLVLQTEDKNCLSWFTDGIFYCTWRGNVDVWCKFK